MTETEYEIKESEGKAVVTTPYLDPGKNKIKIYRQRSHGKFIIHDNCRVMEVIDKDGLSPDQGSLDRILIRHGVRLAQNNALVVRASEGDLESKQESLIRTIRDIYKLAYGEDYEK